MQPKILPILLLLTAFCAACVRPSNGAPLPAQPALLPAASSTPLPATPTASALAQPHATVPISPENASQLQQTARFGEGPITQAVWSPDGQTLAVAHRAGIALLSAQTLTETSFWETAAAPQSLAYSPDGSLLAAGESDGRIEIFAPSGASSGTPSSAPVQTLQRQSHSITGLAFSPDGRTLLSASAGEAVYVWNLSAAPAAGTPSPFTCESCGLGFTSDGQPLAWKFENGIIQVLDPASGKPLRSQLTGPVLSFAFTPDAARLVTAGEAAILHTYAASGAAFQPGSPLPPLQGSISSVALSRDGALLAVALDEGQILFFDTRSNQFTHTPASGSGGVSTMQFSPDGLKLLALGDDQAQIWDVKTGALLNTLENPPAQVSALFAPDGRLIETLSSKTASLLIEPVSARVIRRDHPEGQGSPWNFVVSPDARLLAVHDGATTIQILSLTSDQTPLSLADFPGPLTRLLFSPDNKILFGHFALPDTATSANPQAILRAWDLAAGKALYSTQVPFAQVLAAGTNASGIIALGGTNPAILILDASSGKTIHTLTTLGSVTSLAFSPDGRLLASGGAGGALQLWDLQTAQLFKTFSDPASQNSLSSLAFSPDGRLLASGASTGAIQLWDVSSGKPLALLSAHHAQVDTLAFNPAGTQLASAAQDGTVRLWEVK